MKPKRIPPALLLCLPLCAQAYDSARAGNNLGHEYAQCAAYYLMFSQTPKLDENAATTMKQAAESSIKASVMLTSEKLTTARIDMAVQEMKDDMEGTWDNASVVLAKYAYFCRDLLSDPESRMKYWLDKAD